MGGDVRLGGKQFRGVPQTLSTGAATPDSPSQTFSVRLPPMRNLTTTICLTISVIIGVTGETSLHPLEVR